MRQKKQVFSFRKLSVGLASVAIATTFFGLANSGTQVQAADGERTTAEKNVVPEKGDEKTDKQDQTYKTATKTVDYQFEGKSVGKQTISGAQIKDSDQFEFPAVVAEIPAGYESSTKVIEKSTSTGDVTITINVTKKEDSKSETDASEKVTRTIHFVDEKGKELHKDVTQEGTKNASGKVSFDNPTLPVIDGYKIFDGYEADLGKLDNSSANDVTVVYRKLAAAGDTTIYSSKDPDPKDTNHESVTNQHPEKTPLQKFNFEFKVVDKDGNLISTIPLGNVSFDQNYTYSYNKYKNETSYSGLIPDLNDIKNNFDKQLGVTVTPNTKDGKLYINGLPLRTVTIDGEEYEVRYVTNEYHSQGGLKYDDLDSKAVTDKDYYNFIKTHGYKPDDLGSGATFGIGYIPNATSAGYLPEITSLSNNTVIYLVAKPSTPTDTYVPSEPTTSIVSENKTVNEVIHYVYEDGTKAHDDYVAVPVVFTRTGVRDDSTGIVTWDAWSPAQYFQAVTSPTIDGYTPDKAVIDQVMVTGDSSDQVFTVTYKKNQPATPETSETPDKPTTPSKDTKTPEKPSTPAPTKNVTPNTSVSEKPEQATLPQTGQKESGLLSLIGLAMMAVTGLFAGKRKKN